jgi:hypothetical protein
MRIFRLKFMRLLHRVHIGAFCVAIETFNATCPIDASSTATDGTARISNTARKVCARDGIARIAHYGQTGGIQ